MKVLALVGSLRVGSSNLALVRAAEGGAPAGTTISIFDGIAGLPHFSPDDDAAPGPAVLALRAAVGAADALLLVSPEYAHGMPGALKNALDHLVSALEPIDKPILLVCASPAGAVHAHAQFAEVLRTMSMRVVDGGAHVFSRAKLDEHGVVTDPSILAHLGAAMARLAAAVAERATLSDAGAVANER